MSVSIQKGGPFVYSLTSPPESPTPQPPAELIAEAMSFGDRTIFVTVPFPDTIELTANILNEHLQIPSTTGGGAKAIGVALDAEFKKFLALTKSESLADPKPFVKLGEKAEAVFTFKYDPLQPLHTARLTLHRLPGQDFGSWAIRFEFSAAKAGPTGLVKLIAAFEEALPLSFTNMLPAFRVSRVDPAIDLIGASPLDLIPHIEKLGKRMLYIGQSGRPESIYLYEQRKPLTGPPHTLSVNTRGPLRMKLYERRDYLKQLNLSTPYGDCPVTRIEVERRWKSKTQRPLLSQLAHIKNPLKGRRVAYAARLANDVGKPLDWLAFCLAAFGGGVATARHHWPSLGAGLSYQKLYLSCAGDLVNEDRWSSWSKGLTFTGLEMWIDATSATVKPPI